MLRKMRIKGRAMKRVLTIGLAIAAAGVSFSSVEAGSLRHERVSAAAVLPASDILSTVREMGFAPNSEVVRRGPYYVLHAVDLRGVELRIVADAQFGDILWVMPAWPYYYVPYYVRAPHIIHIPDEVKPRKHSEAAPSPKSAAKKDTGLAKDAPEQAAIAPAKVLSTDE
jgi:hypothetical protein